MFARLKNLDPSGKQSWMDLPEMSPTARLLLKPAGESNSPYYNAMLRRSARRARHLARTDQVQAEDLAQSRNDDRDLFPQHVIAGWEGLEDDAGQLVPYSAEAAQALCKELPDWLFDRVRNHAQTPERFLALGEDPPPDSRAIAGN